MGELSEYQKRELRSPDGIANAIIFKRNYPGNESLSFLIVEGDTDRRLYSTFVNEARCNINVAYSKSTALEVLSILEQGNFPGILIIIDADFDILEGKSLTGSNILLTDTHDLETMIIQSPALEKVLGEFGSEDKLAVFTKKAGKDIRAILLEKSLPIGYLRWLSLRESLSLNFEDVDFSKFVDKDAFSIDARKLIRVVKSRSSGTGRDKSQSRPVTDAEIQHKMQQIKDDTHNTWHVCCGHDLVDVLSIGLCKAIGTWNAGDVKRDVIERSLRLAYEYSHFQKTRLYVSIRKWEQANSPFVVLKTE